MKNCQNFLAFLLVLFYFCTKTTNGLSKSDPSGFVSVSYYEGKWKIIPYLVEFSENDHIVAIANFTNTQNSNGWMLLEVQTRERNGFISFYE